MQYTSCSIVEYQQNITVIIHKDIQCESNAQIKAILQYKKQNPLHKKDAAFFASTTVHRVPSRKGFNKQDVSRTITTNSPSSLKEGRMMHARAHTKIMGAAAFIHCHCHFPVVPHSQTPPVSCGFLS